MRQSFYQNLGDLFLGLRIQVAKGAWIVNDFLLENKHRPLEWVLRAILSHDWLAGDLWRTVSDEYSSDSSTTEPLRIDRIIYLSLVQWPFKGINTHFPSSV